MIILTGGAGFIGSVMLWKLNTMGVSNVLVVDHLGHAEKWKNLSNKKFSDYIHKNQLFSALPSLPGVEAIIHLGACSSTTESDADYLMENNYRYSKRLWHWAVERAIPFIYASSAATYGNGESGYEDDQTRLDHLMPLNGYGLSKHAFDKWVVAQTERPPQWAGLKFFNVYGPNEYHKGQMASVVSHAFHEVAASGRIKLFKSYRPDFANGAQQRDFVYVKDVAEIIAFLLERRNVSGLLNVGTGEARSFNDLAGAVFSACGCKPAVEYVDMPDGLSARYQYFTQATVSKLREVGYHRPFTSLEAGIRDYVTEYLAQNNRVL